jgi:phage baseplate assembly protein V
MSALKSAHAQLAQMVAAGLAVTRLGTVTSYDPATYSAKVMIQPNATETGWLPIASAWVGNQWGMYCPPSQGDQVKVVFQEADSLVGIIDGCLYSDVDQPLSVNSGEFWLVHQTGAFIKLTNDGKLSMQDAAASSLVFNNDGTVTLTATTFNIDADVNITGTTTGSDDGVFNSISVDNHTHGGVEPGDGDTDPPNG